MKAYDKSNNKYTYYLILPLVRTSLDRGWTRGILKSNQFMPLYLYQLWIPLNKTPCSYGKNRKEQVVLTRCRIGHSRLTQSYLLNIEERPMCIPWNSNYSLRHVLIDCMDVVDVRQIFYNVNCLSNLFTNVAGDTILQFFKRN